MSSDTGRQNVTIGGLPIALSTRTEAAAALVGEALRRRGPDERPFLSTSANANVLSQCARDPGIRDTYLAFDAIHADGMSVVFASRFVASRALPERVATTDLFHDVAREAQSKGATFFLLGARNEVLKSAHLNVGRLYPDLKIVGTHDGYFSLEDEDRIVERINRARPDILWVGIGVPAAQQFCLRNLGRLAGVGAIKTCGGLFDFLSGRRNRAPQWMQSAGLEWLYRLAQEPRRLARRNLVTNMHAIYLFVSRTR
ncbi:WecB/TagA/CpsF family glycosyltransferase [Hoeflea poritis]|uniref:WecB/TagA/CpsF family glycosyltransferase n=1 Tax=Hoeflea poritis TaxID=2993659 RepID=A0ABT4VUF5_9HYPH|nr:WecB/TagA/CpsF family glycosyltransferase [Hoeflea poritis]MDA4848344.1 WecB/TagA/CpsF family glycosyltransferase [Hoeflea poritis]